MGMLLAPCLLRNPNTGYTPAGAMFFDGSDDYLSWLPASNGTEETYTVSAWVKPTEFGRTRCIITPQGSVTWSYFEFLSGDQLYNQATDTGGYGGYRYTDALYRDPSSWMHVMIAVDTTISSPPGNRMRMYVNGIEVTDFFDPLDPAQNTVTNFNTTLGLYIGYRDNGGATNTYFSGYMTDLVVIDGQQLDPNSFGEFVDGAWYPIDPSGLAFGGNGFYLDGTDRFDKSGDKDATYSMLVGGGGATNYGFVAATFVDLETPIPNGATITEIGYQVVSGARSAVNVGIVERTSAGNFTVLQAITPNHTGSGYEFFAFNQVIPDTGDYYMFISGPGGSNGVGSPNGWGAGYGNYVAYGGTEYSSGSFTLTEYPAPSTNYMIAMAIKSDKDRIVFQSNGVQYGLADSPGNSAKDNVGNYATLNPLWMTNGGSLSEGNLKLTGSAEAHQSYPSTFPTDKTGLWYWECQPLSHSSPGNSYPGFGDLEHINTMGTGNVGMHTTGSGYSFYRSYGTGSTDDYVYVKGVYNGNPGFGESTSGGLGVWMACALDLDHGFFYLGKISGGVITWVNGGDPMSGALGTGAVFTVDTGKEYFVVENVYGSSGNVAEVNFGAGGWNAATLPSGYKAIHTANKAAVSTKTSDHAAIVLWSGTGANQNLDLDFTPDFVWAKRRDAVSQHVVYDVLRGENNEINTDLTNSERTNDYGLDFLGHNGLEVEGSKYFGGSGLAQYEFWALCFKAGGAGVANSDGSIICTVSANTVSGFSIVKGAQGGANFTFGHGLGVAPELVIYKPTNYPSSWSVWHKDLSTGGYFLYLDTTISETNGGSNGFIHSATPPDSSVVYMGSGLTDTSVQFVAYCFAGIDVLDTSIFKIGSFTASGSNSGSVVDGDFVYMDGTPLWKLQKSAGLAQSWAMQDSVMDDGDNPISSMLSPDTSGGENFPYGAGAEVNDFVSNGYKRRRDWGPFGYSGNKQIYLAILADRVAQNNRGR